jgi:hypothetical protein
MREKQPSYWRWFWERCSRPEQPGGPWQRGDWDGGGYYGPMVPA